MSEKKNKVFDQASNFQLSPQRKDHFMLTSTEHKPKIVMVSSEIERISHEYEQFMRDLP